jgi:hypothetical protein
MPKFVRRDALTSQGWDPLGRSRHVFLQLEANAGSFERITVAIFSQTNLFRMRI